VGVSLSGLISGIFPHAEECKITHVLNRHITSLITRIQVDPCHIHYMRETCPLVHTNNVQLPQEQDVKYLGLHLGRRLTWHKRIFVKRKQLGISLTKIYWLCGCKSKLSASNKLLIYKTILKPIWTYGIQLWGTTSPSNIEILEGFQLKALHMIVDAP
jgi:hypothetical protein